MFIGWWWQSPRSPANPTDGAPGRCRPQTTHCVGSRVTALSISVKYFSQNAWDLIDSARWEEKGGVALWSAIVIGAPASFRLQPMLLIFDVRHSFRSRLVGCDAHTIGNVAIFSVKLGVYHSNSVEAALMVWTQISSRWYKWFTVVFLLLVLNMFQVQSHMRIISYVGTI